MLVAPLEAFSQEIVTVDTRLGVTQSFYVPSMGNRKPVAMAVLLTGNIRLRNEEDRIRFNTGSFLLRSWRAYIRNGILPVIPDGPSDLAAISINDTYRRSAEQAADMRAVLGELRKRYPGLPVFLVGTSRSTVSVANLAAVLDAEIAGAVLSASLFYEGRSNTRQVQQPLLLAFNFSALRVPVLLAHHVDDACAPAPYHAAVRLSQRFAYPLITVKGGHPNKSGVCDSLSAHGFYGKESETVDAIAGWMLGRPFAREIQ